MIHVGNLESTIKSPLKNALNSYDDKPGNNAAKGALKTAWNEVQKEVGRFASLFISI